MRGKVFTGKLLIRLKLKTRNTDWGRYKTELAENTDYRKFSDIFRQVLSGNEVQRVELEKYLADLYGKGLLVYGMHAAPTALLTCLIFSYNGAHMHLVDGGNGGYALAAAALKERLKNLRASRSQSGFKPSFGFQRSSSSSLRWRASSSWILCCSIRNRTYATKRMPVRKRKPMPIAGVITTSGSLEREPPPPRGENYGLNSCASLRASSCAKTQWYWEN
jgi:hypothetical protein